VNNLVSRLLLFFIAIPLIIFTLIYLNFYNNLLIVIIALAFAGGCSWELAWLFVSKGVKVRPITFVVFGVSIPACAYAVGIVPGLSSNGIGPLFVVSSILATLAFSPMAFARNEEDLQSTISKASAYSFALFYPGALTAFIVLMAALPNGWIAIIIFCLVTFANDSFAWLFGMTLGKKRGVFLVSPNKSLAGFAGGIAGSLIASFHLPIIFGDIVSSNPLLLFAFGLSMGLTGIVGDLFESALKRSAKVKDSGAAVPGRGGFLDSFDNQLFSAPLAYAFLAIFGLMIRN
jgi:phosphatidate cytidylyltransferase